MPLFLQSLPEEERDRVMTEEKLGGAKLTAAVASSPHRTRSPSIKVKKQLHLLFPASTITTLNQPVSCFLQEQSREPEPEQWVPPPAPKERRDGKKSAKLPETPKTAEEMWQHSVIGDYLAKYRVSFLSKNFFSTFY